MSFSKMMSTVGKAMVAGGVIIGAIAVTKSNVGDRDGFMDALDKYYVNKEEASSGSPVDEPLENAEWIKRLTDKATSSVTKVAVEASNSHVQLQDGYMDCLDKYYMDEVVCSDSGEVAKYSLPTIISLPMKDSKFLMDIDVDFEEVVDTPKMIMGNLNIHLPVRSFMDMDADFDDVLATSATKSHCYECEGSKKSVEDSKRWSGSELYSAERDNNMS